MTAKIEDMTVIEHLDELRKRIIIGFGAVVLFSVLAFIKAADMVELLKMPLGNVDLIFISPVEGFVTKVKVAVFGGIVAASPILFLQILLFIAPALYKKEKILLFSFLPWMIALFLGGIYFGYRFILPMTLQYLMSFGGEYMQPMLSAGKYFSFVIFFSLGLGFIFELPVVMLILSGLGIIEYTTLAKKRKYALLMIVTVTAILTPTPDAVTLLAVSLPLVLLFELSLGMMYIFHRIRQGRRKKIHE